MNDIWNQRRKKSEEIVIKSVLDLFEHTGSNSFKIPLDPPHEILFVIAGDIRYLKSMIGD